MSKKVFVLFSLILIAQLVVEGQNRKRARDCGVEIGILKPGKWNAITDVKGVKVGHIRLIVIWPFPENRIRQLAKRVRAFVVPELNYGQIVLEVERAAAGQCPAICVPHGGGSVHDPETICQAILELEVHPALIVTGLSIVYVFLGMFLDPVGVMLLTLPVVYPVMEGLGYNLIWFGIIMIKYLEIGLITPPVGLNVYVIKGVVGDTVPLETIFRGIAWFVAMDILTLAVLIAFPQITLFLPDSMMGP